MSARRGLVEPPVSVVDCTGVYIGNADIEASSQWAPTQKAPERPRLPGHEHDVDWGDYLVPSAPRGLL